MRKYFALLTYLAFFSIAGVHAQRLQSMEFRNQAITDILMVLAEATGTSIVPDDTVTGTASFYFAESDFEEALGLFLSTYKLFYERTGSVFRVSRIKSGYDRPSGTVKLIGEDVSAESLVKALSRAIGKTILYDPLPRLTLTVDIDGLSPGQALEIICRRLTGYAIETKDSYSYVRQVPADQTAGKGGSTPAPGGIVRTGDEWALSVDKARFLDLVSELFSKAGREYSLLTRADSVVEDLYFAGKDFDSLLRLLLEQGNADFIVKDGIYYIVELQRRDVVKRLKDTRLIPLKYLAAQDLPNLLPSDLASGNSMKLDKQTNSVILTGSDEEITPIISFIELVDRPLQGMTYRKFDVKYLQVKDAIAVLPQKLTPLPAVAVPGSNSFLLLGTAENLASVADFLSSVDTAREGIPVRLKYLKTDEFLKALPPSVAKDDIVDSGYPNLVFFTGSEEKGRVFLAELESIDRPKPQIRYQLLVIQYLKNRELSTSANLNLSNGQIAEGSVIGNLSNILGLSFDVVSQFGYEFAAKLSLQLGENIAQVYADTTLNGLSGQDIKFQNTETYRYQEQEIDPDTGKATSTGVTKEITSGLIISLNGWVSGNDMITMNVNATVSKRNSNTGSTTTTLPSTSERVVNTQVRSPSGKPVVLSGLIKEDTNTNVQKIPILGDIPLLGRLFKNQTDSVEKTEIVIYIVPYLAREETEDRDRSLRLERYYRSFARASARAVPVGSAK